jgi:hypothetical protein
MKGMVRLQDVELYRCALPNNEVKFSAIEPVKYAGYWVIDPTPGFQTKFAVKKKPTEEHIKNHELLLGWIWEDAK